MRIIRDDRHDGQPNVVRPHPSEPGTLQQQLLSIARYFDERRAGYDRAESWQRSRERFIPHARQEGESR